MPFHRGFIPLIVADMPEQQSDLSRRPLKSRSTAWARGLSTFLVGKKVSPNAISVFGIFAALAGAGAMLAGGSWLPVWVGYLIGAAGVQVRLVCNLMDGLVAVEGKLKTKAGDWFNEGPDRIQDTVLLAAAGHAAGHGELGWACATLAVGTAYVRAFGASHGLGQDFRGPGAKPHRMAVLTIGLLAGAGCAFFNVNAPVLCAALWVVAGLTVITIFRRTLRVYERLP